jgi:hypothetical protein
MEEHYDHTMDVNELTAKLAIHVNNHLEAAFKRRGV